MAAQHDGNVRPRGWHPRWTVPPGYQRHHILPISLYRRPQIGEFLMLCERHGLAPAGSTANGVILPATERAAPATGHALHRGPHPGYSDVIAATVERVRQRHAARRPGVGDGRADRDASVAVRQLRALRHATLAALTDGHGTGLWLNRRDPMRLFADCAYLDQAIDQLFAVAVPS